MGSFAIAKLPLGNVTHPLKIAISLGEQDAAVTVLQASFIRPDTDLLL
eukprot:NODE_6512_length_281_cov_86.168103_g5900_i0.p2 GENE.NODE_6512_length_281_cov_86.168103_g5900_i0~~NODE_6512_length_281_cov_86.168103_g5900_i0.p2  ORF type:complete len:56 (+),score=17.26 NODE_6512_length_281_cov_86.168103_g5900_i0:26-169(+)